MANDLPSTAIAAFESVVERALEQDTRGARLLVAVSGGVDSCSLLASVARLKKRLGYTLFCVHVVHGIRSLAESRRDVSVVRSLCERFSVPCSVLSIPEGAIVKRARSTGKGIEDAARYFRHRALVREADRSGADLILIGHTKNDLLETTLMRFLRGSGPAGLAALPHSKGRILRPLLDLSRADVISYNASLGVSFAEDSTNADPRYLRNRIRGRLIPVLDAEFPGWKTAVGSVSRTQTSVARFIEEEAKKKISWAVPFALSETLETNAVAFFAADPVLRAEALYQAVDSLMRVIRKRKSRILPDAEALTEREPTRKAVEIFASGAVNAQNLGKVRALRRGESIIVESVSTAEREKGVSLVLAKPGTYSFEGLSFLIDGHHVEKGLPMVLPLVVRSPRRSELSQLRSAFAAFRPTISTRFVVEDMVGVGALVLAHEDGTIKLTGDMQKSRVTGYADSVFFSIL
ncbi:MAG: tRNA lysidine(34) synthetase TilS [Treponemataceae bacterium]